MLHKPKATRIWRGELECPFPALSIRSGLWAAAWLSLSVPAWGSLGDPWWLQPHQHPAGTGQFVGPFTDSSRGRGPGLCPVTSCWLPPAAAGLLSLWLGASVPSGRRSPPQDRCGVNRLPGQPSETTSAPPPASPRAAPGSRLGGSSGASGAIAAPRHGALQTGQAQTRGREVCAWRQEAVTPGLGSLLFQPPRATGTG